MAQGFKSIPIKFHAKSNASHELFIKPHSVRNADEATPVGRTLFVLNIPPYVTEKSLKYSFSQAGKVTKVTLNASDKANCGFKSGFIVYKAEGSVEKALKLTNLNPLSSKEAPLKTGLYKYMEEYNKSICNAEQLELKANTFIARFDVKTKKEARKQKQDAASEDDGWTVVTKKSRNPGIARKESVENKLQEKLQKKSKKKELKNFYTFQIRESKMKNIAELRKSYEEAKNKVQLMKSLRRFKPY